MSKDPSPPDVAAAPGPLVSAAWLASHLDAPGLLVVDIRSSVDGGGRQAFEAGHVPGSVHSDYVQDGWRASRGAATGLLPDAAHLSALFGRLGIRPGEHVVIVPAGVSAGDFSAAARVYWTLKIAGHERLSILDGGFAEWRRDPSRPLESGAPRPRPTSPYPVQFRESLRAQTADLERAVGSGQSALVDARSASYFEGREKSPQARVPGRLPGALNVDHAQAYDPATNRLKPPEHLQQLFGAVPPGPVISYCNTGHQAATTWFVLSELLGRAPASLSDGSMAEWTADPGRPVATGPSGPSRQEP